VAIVFAACIEADAATLRVAWDASSDPAVAGYKVSMGTRSGVYTVIVDAGTQTTEQFNNLTAGATYYFVVQAYDRLGNLSPPSAEVAGVAPSSSALAIVCPVPTAGSATGAPVAVAFSASASGGVPPVTTTCAPASGSLFSVGSTPVLCTARDTAGAVATCGTAVVVIAPARKADPTSPPCRECPIPR
jgi:hypothetical protein